MAAPLLAKQPSPMSLQNTYSRRDDTSFVARLMIFIHLVTNTGLVNVAIRQARIMLKDTITLLSVAVYSNHYVKVVADVAVSHFGIAIVMLHFLNSGRTLQVTQFSLLMVSFYCGPTSDTSGIMLFGSPSIGTPCLRVQ